MSTERSIDRRRSYAAIAAAFLIICIAVLFIRTARSDRLQRLHDRFTGTGQYAMTGRFAETGDSEAVRMGALFELRDEKVLRRGMSRKQVARLLGEPYIRFPVGGKVEQWRYSLPGGGLGINFSLDGRTTEFVQWFEEDHPVKPESW